MVTEWGVARLKGLSLAERVRQAFDVVKVDQDTGEKQRATRRRLYVALGPLTWSDRAIDAASAKLLRRANRAAIIAPPAESVRRAAMLAEIGWQRWKRKQTDAAESLAPLYLREPG